MLTISKYLLYFFLYSFIGWALEVVCKLVQYHRFVNRGFLVGPICPIYGYGAIIVILLIGNTTDPLDTFLKSIFVFSILEYFTSYFMEKIFKARWWDYSNYKFNINGRICLETMVPFGLLGCLLIYVVHPFVVNIVNILNQTLIIVLAVIFLIIYIIDNIISFNVMNKIKDEIKKNRSDSTEVIKAKIHDFLSSKSYLYKRIKKAFPKIKITDLRSKIKK